MSKRRKKHRSAPPPAAGAPAKESASGPAATTGAATTATTATSDDAAASSAAAEASAAPGQEMTFSESISHWLSRGEGEAPEHDDDAVTMRFDPRAQGRKREIAVISGAILLGLGLIWVLRGQAHERAAATASTATAAVAAAGASRTAAAAALIDRADRAFSAGKATEASDLARQALALDPSSVDAYVIIGEVQQAEGRAAEAKATYRKYLELAPFGRLASRARERLAALP